MISFSNLNHYLAGVPLSADEILEFHAARLLLLIRLCGVKNRIDGLTKLAKLDFFVRYPDFFERVSKELGTTAHVEYYSTESPMIRHHYGPWDKRYYDVLAFLECRNLISIVRIYEKTIRFELTDSGISIANQLSKGKEFEELSGQMRSVKKVLGSKSGNVLKQLIYKTFDEEVSKRRMGEVIT